MNEIVKSPVLLNTLVPSEEEGKYFDSIIDEAFLPSIKLLQGTSPEILKDSRLTAGQYYLTVRNKSLGNKVLICVCARRAHALLLINNKKTKESFNYKSPIFQEII